MYNERDSLSARHRITQDRLTCKLKAINQVIVNTFSIWNMQDLSKRINATYIDCPICKDSFLKDFLNKQGKFLLTKMFELSSFDAEQCQSNKSNMVDLPSVVDWKFENSPFHVFKIYIQNKTARNLKIVLFMFLRSTSKIKPQEIWK